MTEDEKLEVLGEGIHVSFRKGTDGPKGTAAWKAISEMPRAEWRGYLRYLIWGLDVMGYEVLVPKEERKALVTEVLKRVEALYDAEWQVSGEPYSIRPLQQVALEYEVGDVHPGITRDEVEQAMRSKNRWSETVDAVYALLKKEAFRG